MTGKRSNILRQFHLLVAREPEGFSWQVRYNKHANPVERSSRFYATHSEAAADGNQALERHRSLVRNED